MELLTVTGYHGLTMDAIAATAHVGKSTIYRRWPSKADLVVGLISEASEGLVVPNAGDLRTDLVALLQRLTDVLAGPGGRVSRAVLEALVYEPELADAYRRGPLKLWSDAFSAVFVQAHQRGEVAAVAATSLAAEAASAILLQRWLFVPRGLDASVSASIVDEVVLPALRLQKANAPDIRAQGQRPHRPGGIEASLLGRGWGADS